MLNGCWKRENKRNLPLRTSPLIMIQSVYVTISLLSHRCARGIVFIDKWLDLHMVKGFFCFVIYFLNCFCLKNILNVFYGFSLSKTKKYKIICHFNIFSIKKPYITMFFVFLFSSISALNWFSNKNILVITSVLFITLS